ALKTTVDVARCYPAMDIVRETTLHHLALACEDLEGKGLGGKVNPPIRDRSDNEALWAGLRPRARDHGGLRSRVLHGGVQGRRPLAVRGHRGQGLAYRHHPARRARVPRRRGHGRDARGVPASLGAAGEGVAARRATRVRPIAGAWALTSDS